MTQTVREGRVASENGSPAGTGSSARRSLIWDDFGLRMRWRLLIALVCSALTIAVGAQSSSHEIYLITVIVMWALVAACLNIVFGLAGQLALGQGAFLALGAYIGVIGTGRFDWSGWVSLAVAGTAAAIITLLLGMVIFRARGLYFALLTTGLALVAYEVAEVWTSVTGGTAGVSTSGPIALGGAAKPFRLWPFTIDEDQSYLVLGTVVLALVLLATTVILRRKTGASWLAIREDETLAASVGIGVAKGKRIAFVLASVLVALVGVIYGHWLGYVLPENFSFATASFGPLAMVVIGGSGSIAGPVIGAVVVAGLPEMFRGLQSLSTLAYGALLLFVMLLMPSGIGGLFKQGWRWAVRRFRRPADTSQTKDGNDRDN
ncbi:amino acid/amide ABC transporter membrane protein 2 (HAAT family) [Antricoccus suffuscus]|uniref:Amino acid/amide ABC transporter membrane protein 2 (HAAT family) n=1 Tax=Antricoccus suffuscus TaxID=1629062 RepID=A0A2T0ZX03_9ACTN|nr:branched-chain amino acid ABC transporter permease [Antricoccus suffuscus]PRZ40863.1 amino acid/amide ABC transporter membrane protein 2 (HAAT family) [Antricoccus suffuscus]